MELKINIGYNEVLELIKQLSPKQKLQLKAELENSLKSETSSKTATAFQKLLLKGPIMEDSQYHECNKNRKHFTTWRTL